MDAWCDAAYRKKFKGSFDTLTLMGAKYYNSQRFKPLTKAGKPLWEFKEFDHRLYCYRECTGEFVKVILFNGWEKQKDQRRGQDQEEMAQIQTAQRLLQEYLDPKERKKTQ